MKLIAALLVIIFPAYFYSIDMIQIESNITLYASQFQSYNAHFSMEIKYPKGKKFQKGTFNYLANGDTTYKLDYSGHMSYVLMKNGKNTTSEMNDVYNGINSLKSLFQILMMKNFEIKINKETESHISLIGLEKIHGSDLPGKTKLYLEYSIGNNMIDSVRYTGDEITPAFDSWIGYTNIQSIPVIQTVKTSIPPVTITILLDDIKFETK